MPILNMTLNGKSIKIEVDGLRTLVDVLREDLGLTGTKIGCREGECGACTVLINGIAVNSCLIPAMKANNCEVLTIEGVGNVNNPHPLQKAIVDEGGVQCGYCTPGFVMSGIGLISQNKLPSELEIREAYAGNLCRCTGYNRIVAGTKKFLEEKQNN